MTIQKRNFIDVDEWDEFVEKTYGRPYNFQQQDGCKGRGIFQFKVPDEADDFKNSSVPEIINHEEMGVSFAAWLARDPKQVLSEDENGDAKWGIDLWWHRNFYPDFQMVANDLHSKGLLPAGEYVLNIDW
jgi:hypothetical protein